MSVQSGANRLTEVFQQVPTIRRLKRLGGAAPGGVGIGGAAIPADHLDLWVLRQPLGNRVGFAVWQQIHHLVTLQIHDDGAVAMAFAPRPVINADGPNHSRFLGFGPADQPEQGVAVGRHGEALRQACAGLTAQSQPKVALDLAQAPGATRSGGDGGQAFGEDPPGALGGGAAKAARLDPDQHGPPLPGQIGEGPEVPAVDPARGVTTDRAAGLRSLRSGRDGDGVGGRHDLLDQQARGNQGENVFGQACSRINGVFLLCAHPMPFCPPASSRLRKSPTLILVAN
jgi:hypothetical protein